MAKEVLNQGVCLIANDGLDSYCRQLATRANINRVEAVLVMAHGVALAMQGMGIAIKRHADVKAYADAIAKLIGTPPTDERACNLALAEVRRTANIIMGYAP